MRNYLYVTTWELGNSMYMNVQILSLVVCLCVVCVCRVHVHVCECRHVCCSALVEQRGHPLVSVLSVFIV